MSDIIYVVNVSGGLSSFEALRRTIDIQGRENTRAVFADVRGDVTRDIHAAPVGTKSVTSTAYPLSELRVNIESGVTDFESLEWGSGCGCFAGATE